MSDPSGGPNDRPPEDAPPAPPPFAPGAAIPGLSSWLLERKLGGGGFGEVWLARHAWNEKEPARAVKFCTDPEARHRLVTHEKNVVLRVMKYAGHHPNIVPLLDCNLDGPFPWLMYEFVEGDTLAGRIEQWRELPLPKRLGQAVRTLYAVAGALGACHRLNPPLVHRDMKPHNILMAGGKVPRITDFGIGGVAVPKDGAAPGALTAFAARIPTALQTSGSWLYSPPEQLFGNPPNPRDDVYALGIIAYQMIAGDLKAGPGPDAELELRDLKVPAELSALIVRSIAMNADRRPRDASEWETTLAAIAQKAQKSSDPMSMVSSGFLPAIGEIPAPPERAGPPPIPTDMRPAARPTDRAPDPPAPPASAPRPKWLVPVLVSALVVGLIAVVLVIALRGR